MNDRYATAAAAIRHSAAGARAVIRRRRELFRERIGEWRTVAKVTTLAGPRESVAHLDRLALAVVQAKLLDVEELARLAVTRQTEAWGTLVGCR